MAAFQIRGHFVAILGVVGHHEQDGFLVQFGMLGRRLAPLDHAQVEVVGVPLGVFRAGPFAELGPTLEVG